MNMFFISCRNAILHGKPSQAKLSQAKLSQAMPCHIMFICPVRAEAVRQDFTLSCSCTMPRATCRTTQCHMPIPHHTMSRHMPMPYHTMPYHMPMPRHTVCHATCQCHVSPNQCHIYAMQKPPHAAMPCHISPTICLTTVSYRRRGRGLISTGHLLPLPPLPHIPPLHQVNHRLYNRPADFHLLPRPVRVSTSGGVGREERRERKVVTYGVAVEAEGGLGLAKGGGRYLCLFHVVLEQTLFRDQLGVLLPLVVARLRVVYCEMQRKIPLVSRFS